jgi:hypothetical protein
MIVGEAMGRVPSAPIPEATQARAHLLDGEWLRRERRRLEAREQLRTGHDMFPSMGSEAFARRAERELLATGERARKRTVRTREDLAAREAQVARLARDGLPNPEVGARLFISPRTVEYHLTRSSASWASTRATSSSSRFRGKPNTPSRSECEAAAASRLVLDAYYKQTRVNRDVRRSELIGDLTPGGSYPGWRSVDKRLALACA